MYVPGLLWICAAPVAAPHWQDTLCNSNLLAVSLLSLLSRHRQILCNPLGPIVFACPNKLVALSWHAASAAVIRVYYAPV